jgi:hypothetical protein
MASLKAAGHIEERHGPENSPSENKKSSWIFFFQRRIVSGLSIEHPLSFCLQKDLWHNTIKKAVAEKPATAFFSQSSEPVQAQRLSVCPFVSRR